ncbi:MAG: hypothetical protein WC869_11860 [Phycisphaerae bacterium]|jgi:hypothetical protein
MKPEIDTLAAALGVQEWARRKWRQRGWVPHRWRLALIGAATERGLDVSEADMDWRANPATRKPARSGAEAA